MWPLFDKLFVRSFYRANAGFFLFFFFLFFGAVQGGSLLSYHLSLMNSILGSGTVLLLVLLCWTLYHLKCTSFFLRIVNSGEGKFLLALQAVSRKRQWLLCAALHTAVYAPVLVYAVVVFCVGIKSGRTTNAVFLLLYQVFSITFFASVLYHRFNHWLQKFSLPSFQLSYRKPFLLLLAFYFMAERKKLLLLKTFSLVILYLVLVWNKGRYDNDAFLYFYLVLLLAHAAAPYLAFQFMEQRFAVSRNLPISLFKRAAAFLLPYCLLFLPEVGYIFYHASAISFSAKLAYVVNLPVSLFLLTAFLYSEAQSRDEYLKATFALAFVTLFAFHAQAFWFWIGVQFIVASILFASGYYSFERQEEE